MSNLKAIHEAARLSPINKIMVVGHPLSGYASVEKVLHRSGLQTAASSKTQGLSPMQVSDMLLRAYKVPPLSAVQTLENFMPLAPSPVWQTLALDLLLGNLEQELWGWADPQAIYLLDYWKSLDHQLAFVLVYDSPQASLASLFDNMEVDCSESVVQAASGNWLTYNEALLNFYLGNTERCLLVHGQQVRAKTADCLRQVQHQMGVELRQPFGFAPVEEKPSAWQALQIDLCQRVLAANPKVAQMYADMQSVASLPQGKVTDKPSFDTDMAVLSKFVALQRSNLKIQQLVDELKAAKEAQEQQLQQARDEVNQHAAAVADDYVTSNKALEEENQMLLEELHKVQEELEQVHIQNQQLQFKVHQAEEWLSPNLRGAAKLIKDDLPYKLGSAVVKCQRSFKSYLSLPFKLRKISKEFSKNRLNGNAQKPTQLLDYEDRDEAEKVKQHLSYKFGEILVQSAGNPVSWLMLPYRLTMAHHTWRLHRG
jgi:hypothetical protein